MPWIEWCLLKQYTQWQSLIIFINFYISPFLGFQIVCNNINIQLATGMDSSFRWGDGFHCRVLEERKSDKLHNVAKLWLGRGEIKERITTFFDTVEGMSLAEVVNRRLKILRCAFLSVYKVEPSSMLEKSMRAKMRKLNELEVGLHCLKSRKTCHGNKEVYFRAICKKVVVQLFEWEILV